MIPNKLINAREKILQQIPIQMNLHFFRFDMWKIENEMIASVLGTVYTQQVNQLTVVLKFRRIHII